ELKSDLLALTQTVESHAIFIRNFEERMDQLVSQIEGGKPPHARVESVDRENIKQDYEEMIFEKSLE
ncbi:hypothetical protein HAX54_045085, partial [Datura stramonium]|nr:hypothetical protein [Datura stramonium]